MNEQELIDLVNGVVLVVTPMNSNGIFITDLDTDLPDTGMDSLDMMMFCIFMGDIYGVDEELIKVMEPKTVRDVIEYMRQHKTKEPTSVKEALESIQ